MNHAAKQTLKSDPQGRNCRALGLELATPLVHVFAMGHPFYCPWVCAGQGDKKHLEEQKTSSQEGPDAVTQWTVAGFPYPMPIHLCWVTVP